MEAEGSYMQAFVSCFEEGSLPTGSPLHLDLVEVNAHDKAELLKDAVKAGRERHEESEALLRRLEELNHDLALQFGRKEDVQDKFTMRLLREPLNSSGLTEHGRVESFIALSYCWHFPDWSLAEGLSKPENAWPISPQMAAAVLNERKSPGEYIWIDQRCINQTDGKEKRETIGSIDLIFQSARLVVAVLEDVRLSYEEEALLWKESRKALSLGRIESRKEREIVARALFKIMSARWFKRAWCSNELQIAQELILVVLVGDHLRKIDREHFDAMTRVIGRYCSRPLDVLKIGRDIDFIENFNRFGRPAHMTSKWWDNGGSLTSRFLWIHELDCSVQTDRISICLSIAGLNIYFKGTSKSARECRWITAVIALAGDDGTVLDGIGELCLDSQAIHQQVISKGSHDWLRISPGTGTPRLGSSSKVHSVDHKGICLDMLDLTACPLVRPSKAQVLIASKFVEAVLSKTVIHRKRHEPSSTPTDDVSFQREKMLLSETIACVLYCGLEWILLQLSSGQVSWKNVKFDVLNRKPKDCFFHDEVRDMLIAAEIVEEQKWTLFSRSLIIKLDLFFSYLIFCKPLHSNGSPNLSLERLIRTSYNLKEKKCLVLELGTKGKALIALISCPKDQEIMVVPQALNETSCVSLRRLWYLKKKDDSHPGSWKVTSMYKVFTFRPIEVDENLIIERKSQRISGESFLDLDYPLTKHALPNWRDEAPLVPTSADDVTVNFFKHIRTVFLRLSKEPDGGKRILVFVCRWVRQLVKEKQSSNEHDSRLDQERVKRCIELIVRTVGSIEGLRLDSNTLQSTILELQSYGKDF